MAENYGLWPNELSVLGLNVGSKEKVTEVFHCS